MMFCNVYSDFKKISNPAFTFFSWREYYHIPNSACLHGFVCDLNVILYLVCAVGVRADG